MMKRKYYIYWDQIENISKEMAYILGLLWADGYVLYREPRNSYVVCLTCIKTDFDYFEKYFLKTGKWSILTTNIQKYKDCKRKKQGKVACYEPRFAQLLLENDYKAKSNKSADKILKLIPKTLHPYWFSGLFDGDGSIYINPSGKHFKITVASSFGQDWSYLENLFKELGVSYKIHRRISRKKHKCSNIEVTSRYDILKFKKYIDQSEIRLPRKQEKFKQIEETLTTLWDGLKRGAGIHYRKNKNIYEVYVPKTRKYIGRAGSFEGAQKMRLEAIGY